MKEDAKVNDESHRTPGLHILGLGVAYPPYNIRPEDLRTLAERHYPATPTLNKVLTINEYTGIDQRSSIGDISHESVNRTKAPSIAELCGIFLDHGVALSVTACQEAIEQWGGKVSDLTHIVAVTCTNSANPGFDHFVAKRLGMEAGTERILLHGVGCSGGLAALRTAANVAMGSSFRRRPARILVLACEISTTLVRSELDSIVENDEVRIGITLFSDCASACVIGNEYSLGMADEERILELLGWDHQMIPDTESDLGFDVDPLGWKVVLTQRVPQLTTEAVPNMFNKLTQSIPELAGKPKASQYSWALHPGGSIIISGIQKTMKLTENHLQASYEVYMAHGNSSSATFFSVLKRLLEVSNEEHIIGCAFGPGIAVEMMAFRRHNMLPSDGSGSQSPAETLVAEEVD